MRRLILSLLLFMGAAPPASAQLSIGFGVRTADVSVSINLPVYPDLVLIPGYPVYYAPGLRANFFFYDGYYWLFEDGYWYVSTWYNGPWDWVAPIDVPVFLLRVPVRYYRVLPPAFAHWHRNEPPRWGLYWGPRWERHREGWHHWSRRDVPRPAPLPTYQRRYSGEHYPRLERQEQLRREHYRHRPSEPLLRAPEHGPQRHDMETPPRLLPPGLGRPSSGFERQEAPHRNEERLRERPMRDDDARENDAHDEDRPREAMRPMPPGREPHEADRRGAPPPAMQRPEAPPREFQRPEAPARVDPPRGESRRVDPPRTVQQRDVPREPPGLGRGRGTAQERGSGMERRGGPHERGR